MMRLFFITTALLGSIDAKMNGIALRLNRLSSTHEEMYLQDLKNDSIGVAVKTKLSIGQGVHSVRVYFGNQPRVLIVDTGSADTAFPCNDCQNCGDGHLNPFYGITKDSKYVSCTENDAMGFTSCKSCVSDGNKCVFSESYVEGSGWEAFKIQDSCYFDGNPSVRADVVFGCMHSESGAFLSQAADGIMGMSQDPDAIFLQFYKSGATSMKGFSQCISSYGGSMVIGGLDPSIHTTDMQFTPLRKTGYTYWTVSLESIAVGDRKIDVDASVYNQNRGCVFDSGTTYVYLPSAVKEPFKSQWKTAIINAGLSEDYWEYKEGKEYKFTVHSLLQLPTIEFTFANNAVMQLPPSQYMVYNGDSTYTSTIFFQDFAHATIIGASMLSNYNVLYDMSNNRIGFAQADCDSLASMKLVSNIGGDTFTPEFSWIHFLLETPSTSGFFVGAILLYMVKEVSSSLSKRLAEKRMKLETEDLENDESQQSFRLQVCQ